MLPVLPVADLVGEVNGCGQLQQHGAPAVPTQDVSAVPSSISLTEHEGWNVADRQEELTALMARNPSRGSAHLKFDHRRHQESSPEIGASVQGRPWCGGGFGVRGRHGIFSRKGRTTSAATLSFSGVAETRGRGVFRTCQTYNLKQPCAPTLNPESQPLDPEPSTRGQVRTKVLVRDLDLTQSTTLIRAESRLWLIIRGAQPSTPLW